MLPCGVGSDPPHAIMVKLGSSLPSEKLVASLTERRIDSEPRIALTDPAPLALLGHPSVLPDRKTYATRN